MNTEQLEELRRRVEEERRRMEEDYRLDLAAIERLQQRYTAASSPMTSDTAGNSVGLKTYSSPKAWSEREPDANLPVAAAPPSAPSVLMSDNLESSIRTMFSLGGK